MGGKIEQVGSGCILSILNVNQNQQALYITEILEKQKDKEYFNGFLIQEEVEPWR